LKRLWNGLAGELAASRYTGEQQVGKKEFPMLGLGGPEIIGVMLLVLLLFGGAKIPQLMRGLGEGMREFRKATSDDDDIKTTTTTPGTTVSTTSDTNKTHV